MLLILIRRNFSASLLNLQNEYKLNESIGKTITMLVQTDQIALKYGNSYAQSQNVEQVLILVRLLAQIGEFYLRHDRLADAENCCQEMASIHPMSYLYIYLVINHFINFSFLSSIFINLNKNNQLKILKIHHWLVISLL